MKTVRDQDRDVYLQDTAKPDAGPIGPAILTLGALATAGLWVTDTINWIRAVATDPMSRPYEACIVFVMGCLAAYCAWRTLRMAYLMSCALCFLTYDRGRKILSYFDRQRRHR